MRKGVVILGLFSLALFDCATLEPLGASTCGNGVIDANEDCDGFAAPGIASSKCGAPTDGAKACRLSCESVADCPDGWGCGVTGICREPSGKFAAIGEGVSAGVETMVVGDFDGDRRKDIIGSGPQGTTGAAKIRVHYFGENAALAHVNALSAPISSPSVWDFNKDGVDDFAFGFEGGALGVMSGQLDRTLVPAVFPTARLLEYDARPVIAYKEKRLLPNGDSRAYMFAGNIKTKGGGHKNVLASAGEEPYQRDLPVEPKGILGDPVWATIFPNDASSTCGQIVVAMKGDTGKGSIEIHSPCRPAVNPALSEWAVQRAPIVIDPPEALDGGIHVFKRSDNAPAEILFGTRKNATSPRVVYLLRGDGSTLGQPIPTELPDLPIASGDLDRDGKIDFIMPTGFAASNTTPPVGDAGAPPDDINFANYVSVPTGRNVRWTSARIGLFNGDELPDFIAASDEQPDIEFFSATPGSFSTSTISTSGPVTRLAIGDYDGDRLTDIGYVARRSGTSEQFDIGIAYGRTNGPPETPRVVGRTDNVVLFEPAIDPEAPAGSSALGLTIFTSEKTPGAQYPDLALAIVLASGDRQSVAPLILDDRASLKPEADPNVMRDWVPLQVYAGPMREPTRIDLVALAVAFDTSRSGTPIDGESPAGIWVAEGRGGTAFDSPRQVFAEIGKFKVVERQVAFNARTAIGDIDNPKNGTNEVIAILRPPNDDPSYYLRVNGPDSQSGGLEIPNKSIRRDAAMEIVDVDGDGLSDVVAVLDEGTTRRVSVFFNDGKSSFGAPVEVPLPEGEDAQGVSLLTTAGARPFAKVPAKRELAIVTTKRIVIATPSADRASFAVRDIVTEASVPFVHPTALVCGDFDGDGVDDLAIADSGALRIVRQLPERK